MKNIRHERVILSIFRGISCREAYRLEYPNAAEATLTAGMRIACSPAGRARLNWLRRTAAELTVVSSGVTRGEIIDSTRTIRQIAMEGTPVIDREGKPTDAKKPDLAQANRANEILAKMHGFMVDVTKREDLDAELEGMSPEQLKTFIAGILEQLDPNLRKQIVRDAQHSRPAEEGGKDREGADAEPSEPVPTLQ
ncbi:MAG: hypothetical protein ACE5F1_11235 [Planctomycetota bacterium]